MTQTSIRRPATGSKVLVLGFLLAALTAMSLTLTIKSAYAAKTFTVDSSLDRADLNVGDGVCDGLFGQGNHCTLRAALQEANHPNSPGADTINFNIGGGTGVKTIDMIDGLPEITEAVTVDGYSQTGAEPNSQLFGNDAVLKIELNGFSAGPADGLSIRSDGVVVRGVAINNFFFDGIDVRGGRTGKKIEGNFIGTDASGTLDRGNGGDGVHIESSGNFIGGNDADAPNLIAFNGSDGVEILGDANLGNRMLRNSIFSNDEQGIDLGADGPTPNDDKDRDSGPNGLQNTPELISATNAGGQTTISGELNSAPRKPYVVEFFSNDPEEGKTFVGSAAVTTDANGAADFSDVTNLAVPAGQSVTATATDSVSGDTSEFSEAVAVDDGPTPPENEAPAASDDSYKAKKGKTLNVAHPGVLKNDSDPNGDPLTAQLVSNPSKGTLSLNADGSFSYTPSNDFKKGTDSFAYRASDGKGGSDTATVTIKVGKARR